MQQTKFYNSQRLWSILVALCLLTPLHLTAQNNLAFKDSIGTGNNGNGNGEMKFPQGILVLSDGSMWVADNGNSRFQKFDKNGGYVAQFGTNGTGNGEFSSPTGIAQDSQGNLFITDRFNNRVQKFDKDGNFVKVIGTAVATNSNGDFNNPVGIVIDKADNIYVVDRSNDRVSKLTNDGVFIKNIGVGKFQSPYGIAIDSDANIYVTDLTLDNVQKFDSAGTFKETIGAQGTGDGKFGNPQGIAIDPQGNLYVSDTSTDSIHVFNTSNNFVEKFTTVIVGTSKDHSFMTFDDNGTLYIVSEEYDKVYRYATDKEINIKQGTINVALGGTVDFSSVIVSQSSDKTFTIENLGGLDLDLGGTTGSQVEISGTNASDFVITQTNVTDKITGFSSVTFDVSYTPAAVGTSTAMLTIKNNDADEGIYTINLTGTSTSNVTGLDPDLKAGILKVGPNPTKGKLQLSIEGKASSNISYQVVNMQGQVVAKGAPSKGSIDLSQIKAGNYVLLLQIGDEQVARRIQKK